MGLLEGDHVVQAIATQRTDQAFGERIRDTAAQMLEED